jgi:diguanylate cyclase (GGDEF)-like protein
VTLSVSLVRAGDGTPLHFISQIEDITDRKRAEADLIHLASHDSLTGLLNRRRLLEELEQELALTRRDPGHEAGLLLLDIDRFKLVNDTLGHNAGDDVLRALARTLRRRLRATDAIARLGGDEFAVVLRSVGSLDETCSVASDIASALRTQTILTSGGHAKVTVSIGVVSLRHRLDAKDGALIAADAALYAAKRAGRDRISVAA